MLVLSRKTSETILIGGSIVVTVVRIDGQAVRIGVDAPPDVRILRGELVAGDAPAGRPARATAG